MKESDVKLKKVIVTGSEGLLGKTLVKALSSDYEVIRIDLILGHDLTDERDVIEIMNEHKDSIGLVNLFCSNPQPEKSSLDLYSISLDSIRDYLEINVTALLSVCRQFAKVTIKNASIINFSSIYGVSSPKHFIYEKNFEKHIGYTISKSAVHGLTKYLATYLAPRVRVNTVVPGGVFNNQKTQFISEYSKMSPMKRMMLPQEIISTVEYLLSEKSSYTTGSMIHVDGGWTAW